MNDRLVHNCSQILCELLKGKIHVNNLIKQTSIYKNYVFEANTILLENKLAIRTIDERIHKQKEFIELTEMGHELAKIVESIAKFNKCYLQLQNKINENFNILEKGNGKVIKNKLLSRGWTNEEIKHYADFALEVDEFRKICPSQFINALFNRYILFLYKFRPKSYVKDILITVITDGLINHFLADLKEQESLITQSFSGASNDGIAKHANQAISKLHENNVEIFRFISEYTPPIQLNNRFITKEAKNLLESFFYVLKPNKEYLSDYIKSCRHFLRKIVNNERRMEMLAFYEELNRSG